MAHTWLSLLLPLPLPVDRQLCVGVGVRVATALAKHTQLVASDCDGLCQPFGLQTALACRSSDSSLRHPPVSLLVVGLSVAGNERVTQGTDNDDNILHFDRTAAVQSTPGSLRSQQ